MYAHGDLRSLGSLNAQLGGRLRRQFHPVPTAVGKRDMQSRRLRMLVSVRLVMYEDDARIVGAHSHSPQPMVRRCEGNSGRPPPVRVGQICK